MPWQLFAILQPFPNAAQVIILRHLARDRQKTNAAVLNFGLFLIQYACGLVCLPFFGTPNLHAAIEYTGWLLFIAVAFGFANVLVYKALENLSASSFAILATSVSLFTLVTARIFLHESFTAQEGIGSTLLLLAMCRTLWLARHEERQFKNSNWKLGIFFTLLFSICGAIAITTEKYCLNHMSIANYITFGWGLQVPVSLAIALLLGRNQIKQLTRLRILRYGSAAGIMRGLAGILMLSAEAACSNVGLVNTITNSRIILVVLFGMVILKEHKFFWQKLALAALAALALSIII
jgi:drug/metabolite transporter (DMT)-like permease